LNRTTNQSTVISTNKRIFKVFLPGGDEIDSTSIFAVILVPIAIFICPTIEGRRLDDGYPNGKQWRDDDGCPD
jgi:hypothetical protein